MVRWFGWWESSRRASQLKRVHLYTAASLYAFCAAEAALIVFGMARDAEESAVWGLAVAGLVGTAHVAASVVANGAALRAYLGAGPRPDRLLLGYTALTLAGMAAVFVTMAVGGLPKESSTIPVYLAVYSAAPVAMALPIRQGLRVAALPVVAVGLGGAALGATAVAVVIVVAATAAGAVLMGALHRTSAWTLRVMHRLDAARETEARLAVAEERLRFGRDLHDVLGRNLSVIALKSELAVRLARRGPAGSEAVADQMVAQMTEVQRIARESQAEMREVVRGYRAADLHAELAGARGVLEAAGISCHIEDSASSGLPAQVQSALGWVVREGTTNVLRHADADRCAVRLRRSAPGRVVLVMENNGARSPALGAGSGLAGLRERLAALGGSLTTAADAGGSFRLTAEVRLGGDA
ncbi:sensor histidine kinase [Streptomyces hainanensis]|nr:histidine kinase [Streptomyces hainanensis]